MKIKYEFADGMVSEVEVEDSIGAVIIEDRRLEDNLTRKERYHCYSLDAESLMRNFGRRSLTTPRFMPGMTSGLFSKTGGR